MSDVQIGQNLGAYRIMAQAGQGGMATVYKAYHAAMDRYVAVKVLPRQLADNPEFTGRFQQEARTIARLEHPHILPVYDYGESEGIAYLVMRYLDAGTLKERLQAGRLTLSEIDRLFSQLADALAYAHTNGIVHRDLKPSNAMVDSRGELYLTDFGIAKLMEGGAGFTSTGALMGTPAYMSPEQAQGLKVDQRSDIYSLGIILYEMAVGRVPFEAETPLAVLLKHLNEPLPPPTAVQAGLSPAVERVILKSLAKNPDDRFATVEEFLAAWKRALTEVETIQSTPVKVEPPPVPPSPLPTFPPSVVSDTPPTSPPPPPVKRSRLVWVLAAVGIVSVFACLICVGLIVRRALNQTAQRPLTTQEFASEINTPFLEPLGTMVAIPATFEPSGVPSPCVAPHATMTVSAGWTSWTAINQAYGVAIYGDTVFTWGRGGISLWDRKLCEWLGRLGPVEGLPHPYVNAVLIDENNGTLWTGTDDGLAMFDTQNWVIYNKEDGLDSDSITALGWYNGKLLVGTAYSGEAGGGLLEFDGQQWQRVVGFPSAQVEGGADQLSNNVTMIHQTRDGTLWVGTTNGLGQFDGGEWQRFAEDEGLPNTVITILAEDAEGRLVVGTAEGAAWFNGTTFDEVGDFPGGVYGITQDAAGQYWFAGDGGLARFNPAQGDWQRYSEDDGVLPVGTLWQATHDAEGHLFFGSAGGGLIQSDGRTFTAWTVPNVPALTGHARIIPAPNQRLWFVEEYGARVDQFDLGSETWSTATDLPCEYCPALGFDQSERLWMGGYEGVWISGQGAVVHLTTKEGLPSDTVTLMINDREDTVALGTDLGVAIVKDNQVQGVLDTTKGMTSNLVRAMAITSQDELWIGVEGGLNILTTDGKWENYLAGQNFGDGLTAVTGIAEDPTGAVWLATLGDGAYKIPPSGDWLHFSAELPTQDLTSVTIAPDGSIWFGTYYSGALRFEDDLWTTYSIHDGLSHPNINHVYADANNSVWFATSGGVSRYQP